MKNAVCVAECFNHLNAAAAGQRVTIVLAKLRCHLGRKHFIVGLAVKLLAGRRKGLLGRVVGVDIPPVDALDPGQPRQVLHEPGESFFTLLKRCLAPLPLNELANLAADRRHHLQQVSVGRLDLAAEKLNHAQHTSIEHDGKPKRPM